MNEFSCARLRCSVSPGRVSVKFRLSNTPQLVFGRECLALVSAPPNAVDSITPDLQLLAQRLSPVLLVLCCCSDVVSVSVTRSAASNSCLVPDSEPLGFLSGSFG